LLEKIVWAGCKEIEEAERNSREVKGRYLQSVAGGDVDVDAAPEEEEGKSFWGYDEGLDEIRRAVKDA
jgi:anoctamin-10